VVLAALRGPSDLTEDRIRFVRASADWRRQLDRNPDLVGQVLGKVVAVKMRLTPRPGDDVWDLAAEVDDMGVLREADRTSRRR
jgi:hypothetical protein